MIKKKILTIVGARPQFVKAAVISAAIKRENNFEEIIIHTGQHYDDNMSKVFFQNLKIKKPKYYLEVKNLSHNLMISKMISKLDEIYNLEKPSGVIVYGDTNSTLSAAISAKKRKIPVFHIEAGVRNYDEHMPEESNRYLVDRISDINFCATSLNMKNLISEGYNKKFINSKIYRSGDVMFDLFKIFSKLEKKKIDTKKKKNIICTIHRESNIENLNNLKNIISALNTINKTKPILFFAHPRTKKRINEKKIICDFKICDPIGYKNMIEYLLLCELVITDSGGLVREAFYAKKKSLFILENVVWPEIVKQKYSLNVPPNKFKILYGLKNLIRTKSEYKPRIFGNGNAAQFIVKKIYNFIK
tara:strand:+ start:450 stop:1529 length:1080 start_codon:yes stop_codon:yes gene_type:complete